MPFHQYTIDISDQFKDSLIEKLVHIGSLGAVETHNGIVAYFPGASSHDQVSMELRILTELLEKAGHQRQLQYTYELIPDEDWNETWKKGFTPLDVGNRFTILPPWEAKKSGRINIIIDPAMAFGTGHHETTRSCIILIEKYCEDSGKNRFLDLGTGTGLLAIAASNLGYRDIVGIDTDPLAVDAALINIGINDAKNIVIREGSIPDAGTGYDFIAANLISGVLVLLASGISASLSNPGMAVLSGILVGQEDEVIKAMEDAGLSYKDRLIDGKWISLVVER